MQRIFKPRMVLDIPAPRMTTNHDQFLAQGEAWITEDQWRREANLSTNPCANTAQRLSASDFTRPAKSNQRLPSRHVPKPRPIPVSDEVKQRHHQLANLKHIVRVLEANNRVHVEHEMREVARVFVPIVPPAPKLSQREAEAREQVQAQARMAKRAREHWLSIGKMRRPYQPTAKQTAEIVALFGSIEAWRAEAAK